MKQLALSITLATLACGPLPIDLRALQPEPRGTSEVVRDFDDFGSPHAVPDQWQHLVEWHSGTDPVVLLFAVSGRACAVSQWQAHDVMLGRPFRCGWSAPR